MSHQNLIYYHENVLYKVTNSTQWITIRVYSKNYAWYQVPHHLVVINIPTQYQYNYSLYIMCMDNAANSCILIQPWTLFVLVLIHYFPTIIIHIAPSVLLVRPFPYYLDNGQHLNHNLGGYVLYIFGLFPDKFHHNFIRQWLPSPSKICIS